MTTKYMNILVIKFNSANYYQAGTDKKENAIPTDKSDND